MTATQSLRQAGEPAEPEPKPQIAVGVWLNDKIKEIHERNRRLAQDLQRHFEFRLPTDVELVSGDRKVVVESVDFPADYRHSIPGGSIVLYGDENNKFPLRSVEFKGWLSVKLMHVNAELVIFSRTQGITITNSDLRSIAFEESDRPRLTLTESKFRNTKFGGTLDYILACSFDQCELSNCDWSYSLMWERVTLRRTSLPSIADMLDITWDVNNLKEAGMLANYCADFHPEGLAAVYHFNAVGECAYHGVQWHNNRPAQFAENRFRYPLMTPGQVAGFKRRPFDVWAELVSAEHRGNTFLSYEGEEITPLEYVTNPGIRRQRAQYLQQGMDRACFPTRGTPEVVQPNANPPRTAATAPSADSSDDDEEDDDEPVLNYYEVIYRRMETYSETHEARETIEAYSQEEAEELAEERLREGVHLDWEGIGDMDYVDSSDEEVWDVTEE